MCMPLLCKCAKYFFCLYMFVYTPLLNMFHLLVLLAISMFVCLVANKVYCIVKKYCIVYVTANL